MTLCAAVTKLGLPCLNYPKAGGHFCSSHLKLPTLELYRTFFLQSGEMFNVQLADNLREGLLRFAGLQPIGPPLFPGPPSPFVGAAHEWLEHDIHSVLSLVLTVFSANRDSKKLVDLHNRARYCAQQLVNRQATTFRTLDGHGRLILLVVWYLRSTMGEPGLAVLRTLRFEIPDLNPDVTGFHRWLFPNEHQFIFSTSNLLLYLPAPPDTFIYANLSAIKGKEIGLCQEFLELNFLSQGPSILISWSIHPKGKQFGNYLWPFFKLEAVVELVRKDYVTMLVVELRPRPQHIPSDLSETLVACENSDISITN